MKSLHQLARAAHAFGRALPITRGAAFYVTLVLVLSVLSYHNDARTSASLHRTQAGICTVIHGANAAQSATVTRLSAAIDRSTRELKADRSEVTVWRFAARQAQDAEGRRLGLKLVHAWE